MFIFLRVFFSLFTDYDSYRTAVHTQHDSISLISVENIHSVRKPSGSIWTPFYFNIGFHFYFFSARALHLWCESLFAINIGTFGHRPPPSPLLLPVEHWWVSFWYVHRVLSYEFFQGNEKWRAERGRYAEKEKKNEQGGKTYVMMCEIQGLIIILSNGTSYICGDIYIFRVLFFFSCKSQIPKIMRRQTKS